MVRPLAGIIGVASDDAVFLDVTSLQPGDDWKDEILGAVKDSKVFVLCWCCESAESIFVAKEISEALTDKTKRLVPVLFCPAKLPPKLASRQWIDLRGKVVHSCNAAHLKQQQEQLRKRHRTTDSAPDTKAWERARMQKEQLDSSMEEVNTRYFPNIPMASPGPVRLYRLPALGWLVIGIVALCSLIALGAYAAKAIPLDAWKYIGYSVAGLIVVFVLLRLTIRLIRSISERRKGQTDDLARRARSYFESLAKEKTSGA